MNNFSKPIPPLTEEELAEIEALKNMRDDEIDFSDIPKITAAKKLWTIQAINLYRRLLKNKFGDCINFQKCLMKK